MSSYQLPFHILAIGRFKPSEIKAWNTSPLEVDYDDPGRAMEELGISLYVSIPEAFCPSCGLSLNIKKLADFKPDQIIDNDPYLHDVSQARGIIREIESGQLTKDSATQKISKLMNLPGDLVRIMLASYDKPAKSASQASSLDSILSMVAMPGSDGEAKPSAASASARVDAILNGCLANIFADETFRALEAAWRGLQLLIRQGGRGGSAGENRLSVVPVSPDTLGETLGNLVLELVNEPPSLAIIDLTLDNSPVGAELMEKIANFAETLMIPTLVEAGSGFFFVNTMEEMNKLPYLPNYTDSQNFAKWNKFRQESFAAWVSPICNPFLTRYSYGENNKVKAVEFSEKLPLWINPVWALAALAAKSFAETGTPARFTNWRKMRLEGLPLYESSLGCMPTEIPLSQDRLDQLAKIGVMGLASEKDRVFIPYEITAAGSTLSYTMLLSRIFAFLLKAKEELPSGDPDYLEENLRKAFRLFWESSGYALPMDTVLKFDKGDDGKLRLTVHIPPARDILPSGEAISFSFGW